MPFFQNPFPDEYRGNWLLGDRQHIPVFVLKGNAGRGKEDVISWNGSGPFDLSGNDADTNATKYLNINYCLFNFKNWATLQIDLTAGAASAAAETLDEIVAALNANATFAERFIANTDPVGKGQSRAIHIRQKRPITEFKFYISSGQADEVLGFNARAGVGELPSYFSRHTIANRFAYPDSEGMIIELDPVGSTVDANTIDNAVDFRGASLEYDSGTIQEDWQLLRGRSGIYNFQKLTIDVNDRITQIIEYPAGALAGDLGRKITYTYTGATNKNPDTIAEVPYTIQSADLITP